MELFDLFDKLDNPTVNSVRADCCKHSETAMEGTVQLCVDCGVELRRDISFEKEWRYYGNQDSKYVSDPNRCNARRATDKSIFKDVENMGFSDRVVYVANDIYKSVTNGRISRNNCRKSIVFACIFNAYKLLGDPQSGETLIKAFHIDRKKGLQGLKIVSLNTPKDTIMRTTYISPVNIIREIMDKFSASPEQIADVLRIYELVRDRSSIVFFYIQRTGQDISIHNFATKTGLSDITINKIVREVEEICQRTDLAPKISDILDSKLVQR
jgi:hypothetical protein